MKGNSSLRAAFDCQKFVATLQEISKENFTVSDDTILDKLYSHIESNKFDAADYNKTHTAGWLEKIFNGWNEGEYFHGVKVFAIRLVGLVGSSLDGFRILEASNILSHLQNLASSDDVQQDSCLMVPLINVLIVFLKHQSGWKWISQTIIWKCAVKAFYDDRSIYTKRASVQFLSLLLNTSDEYDSNHGMDILSVIFEPLVTSHLIITRQCSNLKNEKGSKDNYLEDEYIRIEDNGKRVDVTQQITSAAKFASDIIGEMLSKPNTNVPATLLLVYRGFNVDTPILQKDVLDSCSSSQNEQAFSMLLLMINLSNASRKHHYIQEHLLHKSVCSLCTVYTKIYTTITSMINQNHFYAVINYCVTCLSWYYKLKKMNNMCRSGCPHCQDFEKTMIDTQKVLLYDHCEMFSTSKFFMMKKEEQTDENLNVDNFVAFNFSQKIFTVLPADADQRQKVQLEHMQLGVLGLIRSLPFISHDRIAFDLFVEVISLIDLLMDIFDVLRHNILPVLLHLLTLVIKLMEEYKLPYWKVHEANIEYLHMVIMRVIFTENIDVRVTITSIQVLKRLLIFIVMPDYLEAVVDVSKRSSKLLTLISKLDSTSWEVRDSILELFQTIIDLSESSPCIVKYYFENDIVQKIFSVGVNDESSYVRASALDFFSRAIRDKQFSSFITPSTLCDHALKAVIDDNSPIVRKVACELVTALYVTHVPSLLSGDAMYETMFVVINKDLDWEVKKAAHIFWECTMRKRLLAKSIPLHPLTHSCHSESKNKTKLQIVEVLKELGHIGCLKAIWLGLNDDCDLKVSQEAFKVLNYLYDLDKDWSYIEHILNPHSASMVVEDEKEIGNSAGIDEKGKTENSSNVLIPEEFFYLVKKQDWKEKLSSRKSWIENTCDDLTSLMDHILNAGNRVDDWDHNAVDCY